MAEPQVALDFRHELVILGFEGNLTEFRHCLDRLAAGIPAAVAAETVEVDVGAGGITLRWRFEVPELLEEPTA